MLINVHRGRKHLEIVDYPEDIERPKTRADCEDGERPCPFISCRHHMFLEVLRSGNIQTRAADVDELDETCSLDIADRGPTTLRATAKIFHLTKEMVRQIEAVAVRNTRTLWRKQWE